MSNILIIGDGVAGDSAATVAARSKGDAEIRIITAENHPFYQRTRLGEILSNETTSEEIILHGEEWYEGRDIDLRLGERVTSIDPKNNSVLTQVGNNFSYDKLLLATGAHPFLPPIEGLNLDNVFTLRTLDDVLEIESSLAETERVAIVGGGILGLESAFGLNRRGIEVTVIEALPRIMNKQLDPTGASYVQSRLEEEGIDFRLDVEAEALRGKATLNSVLLTTGERIAADLAIISAGISPNVELPDAAGIETSRGVIVDEQLRTNFEDIYAAGDVIEQNGRTYGIWPPAQEQGRTAGRHLVGAEAEYDGSLSYYKLKVADIDLISAGVRDENKVEEVITVEDNFEKTYKKFFLNEEEELAGAILVGDRSTYPEVLNALRNNSRFEELNRELNLVE